MNNISSLHKSNILLKKIIFDSDKKAFERLFHLFYSPLCTYAKKYIKEEDIREDIVQDIFVYLWENRLELSTDINIRSYLTISVKNGCLNYLRHKKIVIKHHNETIEISKETAYEFEQIYLLSELESQLEDALSQLPEHLRLVFEKNKREGKTYEEIAKELSISVRTAKRYNKLSLEQLRITLREYTAAFLTSILLILV